MANRDAKLIERTLKDFSLGVMSGNGGGAGSNYVMAIMDYYQVAGKHIDVDSLITLLEHYGINMDEEIAPESQSLTGIILDKINWKEVILFGYNVCSGGADIRIFNVALEDLETAYTFRTILTANKEKIESYVITKDLVEALVESYEASRNIIINSIGNYGENTAFITCEEALSIFK